MDDNDTLQKVLAQKRKIKAEQQAEAVGGCIGTCLGLIVWYGAIGAIEALCIWLLWNAIVPTVFHGPQITFWVAYAMVAFLTLLASFFKSSSKEK